MLSSLCQRFWVMTAAFSWKTSAATTFTTWACRPSGGQDNQLTFVEGGAPWPSLPLGSAAEQADVHGTCSLAKS
jgi:hypothetical protein